MAQAEERFPTTQWTDLDKLHGGDPRRRAQITAHLCERYWKPVYAWLRQYGYPTEDAMDLTQGFFCDIVLERDLIRRADSARGRFRTFIISALKHYTSDAYRKRQAGKRKPKGITRSIDDTDHVIPPFPANASPEDAFVYIWASDLLNDVLETVRRWYQQEEKASHWLIFSDAVVGPSFEGIQRPSNRALCEKYDVQTETRLANILTTVKRRFDSALRQALRPYVAADEDVEDEIRELFKIFSVMRA